MPLFCSKMMFLPFCFFLIIHLTMGSVICKHIKDSDDGINCAAILSMPVNAGIYS